MVAVSALALLAVFLVDFHNAPERSLSAFAVEGAKFPESFQARGQRLLLLGCVLAAVPFCFSWLENSRADTPRFVRTDYMAYVRALRRVGQGNLLFGLELAEALLAVFALLAGLGHHFGPAFPGANLSTMMRKAAYAGWLALPMVVLVLPMAVLFARDVVRAFYAWAPCSRAWGAALGVAAYGVVLSLGYYPALAAQLSPKGVFETYRRAARPSEPLGLLGLSVTGASYYARGRVTAFEKVNQAYDWLVTGTQRRWLALGQKDLAQLNSLYRGGGSLQAASARGTPARSRHNLPIVDAHSSEILLASNILLTSEADNNPLKAWVLNTRPSLSHPMTANLG